MTEDAQHMDTSILMNRQVTNQESVSPAGTSSMLQCMKSTYEQSLNTHGMNSEDTIISGLFYANMLLEEGCHLEAERLTMKVATASRQVHGPEHKTTIKADDLLKECKERYVVVLPDMKRFQAVRYETDGEICVVKGPITNPRIAADEMLHHVENNLIVPAKRCPVICHGLVSASHLNGELGVVRDVKENETGIRLAVHFEKKVGKSALVKTENLRIAFKLPDEKD